MSEKALNDLKWESLLCRRDKHVYNLVKKTLAGKTPQFLKHYFNFNHSIVPRITRQKSLTSFTESQDRVREKGILLLWMYCL